MLHTHTHVAADLCLRSKKKERKQTVEGSTAVKKSFDNNKLQLDKQKRSTMKILFHRQYFNCHMNQSDKSFFWQLEPNKKPNEFLFGQETKKRSFFFPDRLAAPIESDDYQESKDTWTQQLDFQASKSVCANAQKTQCQRGVSIQKQAACNTSW